MLGPVIDESAFERLTRIADHPGDGATQLYRAVLSNLPDGFYVPPVLFEISDPAHFLFQEELFGPIVSIYNAGTFDEALGVAIDTDYALTGGVYSRSPSHIEKAKRAFRVGNLYINRGITGAFVGRQPFGGFQQSGLGTKTGGPGYLLNFADPRVICENTMRRGFSPELQE